MTCLHPPGSVPEAILRCIRLLSDQDLSDYGCPTRGALYAQANDRERQRLAHEDAAALDAALLAKGKPRLFRSIFDEMVRTKLHGPRSATGDISDTLDSLVIGVGDLHAYLREAQKDGKIDDREEHHLGEKFQALSDEALAGRDSVQPPHGLKVATS